MMTEFLDPDHEVMGDAAGDLTDPALDAATAHAREDSAEVAAGAAHDESDTGTDSSAG